MAKINSRIKNAKDRFDSKTGKESSSSGIHKKADQDSHLNFSFKHLQLEHPKGKFCVRSRDGEYLFKILDRLKGFETKLLIPKNNWNYDISAYYPTVLREHIYNYWRQPDLYDGIELLPIKGSVEALSELSNTFNIVFVSSCKGPHYKSKYNWLKKHFPFMKGFISTKEKHFVRCKYLIDDRAENFIYIKPKKTKRILFDTSYDQKVVFIEDFKSDCWADISNYIMDDYYAVN
jgi:5'(3')-deoxyribonucleotidase